MICPSPAGSANLFFAVPTPQSCLKKQNKKNKKSWKSHPSWPASLWESAGNGVGYIADKLSEGQKFVRDGEMQGPFGTLRSRLHDQPGHAFAFLIFSPTLFTTFTSLISIVKPLEGSMADQTRVYFLTNWSPWKTSWHMVDTAAFACPCSLGPHHNRLCAKVP